MSGTEALHTALLGVISFLLTMAIPYFLVIERRLSKIEQTIRSELERVARLVDMIADRLRFLEREHYHNHPHADLRHCGESERQHGGPENENG